MIRDAKGAIFYVNQTTGKSQWAFPPDISGSLLKSLGSDAKKKEV
jgi:hypothetical protein